MSAIRDTIEIRKIIFQQATADLIVIYENYITKLEQKISTLKSENTELLKKIREISTVKREKK